jgi:regulator of chromosome condensation
MAPRRAAAASAAKDDTKSTTEAKSTRPKRAAATPKPAAVTKPAAPAAKKQKAATTKTAVTKAATADKKTTTTAAKKKATAAPATKKRKAVEDDEEEARKPKKSRVSPAPKPRKVVKPKAVKPKVEKPKVVKPKVIINEPPTARLNVYVCGEGSSGELGLGTAKNAVDVKRPRLNPLLPTDTVGVVHVAVGGMHCIALTHDNKIFTWGVNDQGALGRDTAWEGGLKDMDDDKSDTSSDSGSDSGMNPHEATPTAISNDAFPEGTIFVAAAASDSASFVLTDEGLVYGWGTFRVRDQSTSSDERIHS